MRSISIISFSIACPHPYYSMPLLSLTIFQGCEEMSPTVRWILNWILPLFFIAVCEMDEGQKVRKWNNSTTALRPVSVLLSRVMYCLERSSVHLDGWIPTITRRGIIVKWKGNTPPRETINDTEIDDPELPALCFPRSAESTRWSLLASVTHKSWLLLSSVSVNARHLGRLNRDRGRDWNLDCLRYEYLSGSPSASGICRCNWSQSIYESHCRFYDTFIASKQPPRQVSYTQRDQDPKESRQLVVFRNRATSNSSNRLALTSFTVIPNQEE